MRKMWRRFLLLATAIVLGVSAIWWAIPQTKEPPLPDLAQDLSQASAEADLAFKERVRNRFPIGTPEHDVLRALANQGFTVLPDGKSASFEQPSIVCRMIWRIFWTADEAQNIRSINGVHGDICL